MSFSIGFEDIVSVNDDVFDEELVREVDLVEVKDYGLLTLKEVLLVCTPYS